VVIGDGDAGSLPNVVRYEELLAEQRDGYDYPELDERMPRGSATRAAPPATRRASFTRIVRTCCIPWALLRRRRSGSHRRIACMPVVPMFHANAWGFRTRAPSPERRS
jgi:fatty-acyl-CoA synthase